jgi:hypothetical protein
MPVSVVLRAIRPRPSICNGGQKRAPKIRNASYCNTLIKHGTGQRADQNLRHFGLILKPMDLKKNDFGNIPFDYNILDVGEILHLKLT